MVKLLTTKDNPYNPFSHYTDWFIKDVSLGHHTCSKLHRIIGETDFDLTEDEIIISASLEIIENDVTGNYVLVTKDNFDSVINKKGGGST